MMFQAPSRRAPAAGSWVMPPPGSEPDVATNSVSAARSRAECACAAGQLGLRSERRGAQHIIAVAGELDLANAARLDEALRAAEATDVDRIVLDLSGLAFIDSTGLQLIIAADARSRADGDRLTLLRGRTQVQRIFEISRVTDRLPFTD